MQRVAVIGAGAMGRRHADVYAALPNAELVAICDPRTEVAEEAAKALSARAFASVEELISKADVDVIDICTPTPTHLDCIKTAAAAGKHVSCEKPLARSVGEAMEAADVCRQAGVTLFVAHVVRWFPEYRRIKELVQSGAIGDTVEIRTSRGGKAPQGAGNWFANLQLSGGAVLDLIVHDFDWLRSVYGPVRRVYAKGLYNSGIPNTDYALVTLRFENGVIAHVEGNWARPSGFVTSVEVAGTKGLLEFKNTESAPLVIELKTPDGTQSGIQSPNCCAAKDPYYLELEHFITCVDEGKTPDVTGQDAIEAVRIAEAALRSITTGEPVALA